MDVLQQLRVANRKRCHEFGCGEIEDWSLPQWGNAVAGETGELCNIVKKIDRGDYTLEHANENELLANEAADIVIYLDMLCQRAGIDLKNAVVNKFNETSKKKKSDITIYYY